MGSIGADGLTVAAERRCARCAVAASHGARFCASCGIRLDFAFDRDRRDELQLRQLIVLFYDVVGSSRLATTLDPEDFTDIIATLHRRIAPVLVAHGAYLARTMGDGGVVYFGYPAAEEDDAERAVRAGLAAIDVAGQVVDRDNDPLRIRVGIAVGETVIGDIVGYEGAHAWDMGGATPALAYRLQASAEAGTLLVSQRVHALVGHLFTCRDHGQRRLKGWETTQRVWQVLAGRPVLGRFQARATPLNPLVGRAEELAALHALWDGARDGRGAVAVVSGEAGIGKSRLVAEFAANAQGSGRPPVIMSCGAHSGSMALHPCIEALARAIAHVSADGARRTRGAVRRVLRPADTDELDLLCALLSVGAPGPEMPAVTRDASPTQKRERTQLALLALAERLALEAPFIIILEDAHWIDPSTRELLERSVVRVASLPLLVIVTARPGTSLDDWNAPGCHKLSLSPLSERESSQLVDMIAGATVLSSATIRDIVQRSDGLPLFLEEITRGTLDACDDGSPRVAGSSTQHGVPASIHASLVSRLDRLREARGIAQIAAVFGREFDARLLARVAESPSLDEALDRLVEAGIVVPPAEPQRHIYRFRHALIQDAAYGLMLRRQRRELHRRIAGILEADGADPAILAHHCTEAGEISRAIDWWTRAGVDSLMRSAVPEAFAQIDRGFTLLKTQPESDATHRQELALRITYGKALIVTHGHTHPKSDETFARAEWLCRELGSPREMMTAMFCQWAHALLLGRLPQARIKADALLAAGRARRDDAWEMMGHYTRGLTAVPMGEFTAARGSIGLALRMYDPMQRALYGHPTVGDPRVLMLSFMSRASLCLGEADRARVESRQAMEDARRQSLTYTLAFALCQEAFLNIWIGPVERGVACLEELATITADMGNAYFSAVSGLLHGYAIGMSIDPERGLAIMLAAHATHDATGSRMWEPSYRRMEAELLMLAGRVADASDRLSGAEALAHATAALWDESEFPRLRAKLHMLDDDWDAAESALRSAIGAASARSSGLFELRATVDLATLYERRSRSVEIDGLLTPLVDRLERFGETSDLAAARSLLGRAAARAEELVRC